MTKPSEHQEAKSVAFFDFDGTLTKGDTLMPFLKFVVGTPKYYVKLLLVSPVLIAYITKLIRNDVAKEIVLKQFLAGYHVDELFQLGKRFSQEVVPTMLRNEGMERLRWHQAQGHKCVMVSASLKVYLNTWSEGEFFDDLICTDLMKDENGVVTGAISGKNCYGFEKLKQVESWLSTNIVLDTYAYGDTAGDLPMIKKVRKGFLWDGQKNKFVPAGSGMLNER